ncbi:helicase-associated domain-containing protein [Streptacidiphilus jiangxiensis]|uniref:Helicase conserved C-terminal domain-containing protein n=1 Tax=Streptacidiphilus jiangxiensis TaxID=235985 RepID=A0A1H8BBU1_STRJI|nr:helicase-associated domain-containing protein [Streptacidiphilus jiangxiensis]SEM80345.1 Helicase conserved C-terminal domain-containing protein [Streptacidiphilus jiangxiensis]
MLDATIDSLTLWLTSRTPQQRADLLARHPQLLAPRRPQTLRQLAVRHLYGPFADARDWRALARDQLQLLEAAAYLASQTRDWRHPYGCSTADLLAFLDRDRSDADRVEAVLDAVVDRALAWPCAEQRLALHPRIRRLFPHPYVLDTEAIHEHGPLLSPAPPLTTRTASLNPQAQAAAAAGVVHAITTVLTVFTTPVPALARGGVPTQDLRRLAQALNCAQPQARLWLELAGELDLIHEHNQQWQPTAEGRAWPDADPAARLADTARAWLRLPCTPLLPADGGRPRPSLAPVTTSSADARRVILILLAGLAPGQALLDGPTWAAAAHHRAPLLLDPATDAPSSRLRAALGTLTPWCSAGLPAGAAVTAVLEESRLIALTDDGALTPLGRALLDGSTAELLAAAKATLPLQRRAAVLADHRVLATGTPDGALAALMRACADLESTDALAQTWHLTPGSVRRWFDTHPAATADDLAARLAAVASTPIPQTVRYLIDDTARRHGQIRIQPTASVLEVRDEGLAAELAARTDLADLGLRRLGPTLLSSTASAVTVAERLRAHGYAPTSEAASTADTPPAAPPRPELAPVPAPRRAPVDLTAVAAALVPDPPTTPLAASSRAALLKDRARLLGTTDRTTLLRALQHGHSVHIEYLHQRGESTGTITLTRPRLLGPEQLVGDVPAALLPELPLDLGALLVVLPASALAAP